MKVTKPRLSSNKATSKTGHAQLSLVNTVTLPAKVRASSTQMQDEVKVTTTEEHELLLVEGGFKVEVSTKQSLGMKADLNIPWAKLRVIRTNSSMCIMYR